MESIENVQANKRRSTVIHRIRITFVWMSLWFPCDHYENDPAMQRFHCIFTLNRFEMQRRTKKCQCEQVDVQCAGDICIKQMSNDWTCGVLLSLALAYSKEIPTRVLAIA